MSERTCLLPNNIFHDVNICIGANSRLYDTHTLELSLTRFFSRFDAIVFVSRLLTTVCKQHYGTGDAVDPVQFVLHKRNAEITFVAGVETKGQSLQQLATITGQESVEGESFDNNKYYYCYY